MVAITPQVLSKSGTEHGHQVAYFVALQQWSRPVYDHTFAIPNGGARGEDERTRMIRGGQLKAEGVKAGVPDTMTAWPSQFDLRLGPKAYRRFDAHALFIELKKPKKGVIARGQTEWHQRLITQGYAVAVGYGWEEALDITKYYFRQLHADHAISERFARS